MTISDNPCDFSSEFRLGLVLYGGVSLAVYENGVSQEFFRAVKGQGVYTLLKRILDADIIVDIVSGTSAGGINGIMLGYALANNRDFLSSAELWRVYGDLGKLLRPIDDINRNSILDSAGYYQFHLIEAYATMDRYQASNPNDSCSSMAELDVFVTGTNVDGRMYTTFDDVGHAVDIKEHRQLFLLSYRDGRKNEFNPQSINNIATLSRITSCFPVAFEPVLVDISKADQEALVRWGKLSGSAYYLDGGILDNKPFSSTMEAIFRRTATRVVDRLLVYVEPDPEHFKPNPHPAMPSIARAASGALVGIPGYQSISGDLQLIANHNDQVNRYWELYSSVRNALSFVHGSDPPLADDFSILDDCPPQLASYLAARLGQLRERVVIGILKKAGFLQPLVTEEEKEAGTVLVQSFNQWRGSGRATLADFDVYYRMRRLFHLTYRISDLLERGRTSGEGQERKFVPLTPEEKLKYRDLWRRINHQIKLLEMIQFAMEEVVDHAPIEWRDLRRTEPLTIAETRGAIAEERWADVENRLVAVLDTFDRPEVDASVRVWTGLDEGQRLSTERDQRKLFMEALNISKEKATQPKLEQQIPRGNLLHMTDDLEWEVLSGFAPDKKNDEIASEYCNFLKLDAHLFPAERLSGMRSLDQIKVVRFSPADAQSGFSRLPLAQKLCGDELAHFSGFLKSSWRANDVMWGRLDAACQIVETLLTEESLNRAASQSSWPDLAELELRFPKSTESERSALMGEILTVRSGNRTRLSNLRNELICAAQREILQEEIPVVIRESIRQQRTWNNYMIGNPNSPYERGDWRVGIRQLDQAITDYASERLAAEALPSPGGWPQYMKTIYRVGTESWQSDIPKSILLELFSKAGILLRESLLASANSHAKSIRSNLFYRMFVAAPQNILYYIATSDRILPEYARMIMAVVVMMCFTVLVMDLLFFTKLFNTGSHFDVSGAIFWIGVPVFGLVVSALLARWKNRKIAASQRATSPTPSPELPKAIMPRGQAGPSEKTGNA